MRRLAPIFGECSVELLHVSVRVAACRRQKAHARPLHAGKPEDVVVEQRVVGLFREPSATERNNLRYRQLVPVPPSPRLQDGPDDGRDAAEEEDSKHHAAEKGRVSACEEGVPCEAADEH